MWIETHRRGASELNALFQGSQHSDENLEKFGRKLCTVAGGAISVDLCDAYASTPKVSELEAYDAVVVAGTQRFADAVPCSLPTQCTLTSPSLDPIGD